MSTAIKQFYTTILEKNICEIKYTNPYDKSAAVRTINCTLQPDFIRECNQGISEPLVDVKDAINVVDSDRLYWRLIPINQIKSCKVLSGSLSTIPTENMITSKYAKLRDTVDTNVRIHTAKIVKTSVVPAKKLWLINQLSKGSCRILYTDLHKQHQSVVGSLESWVLDVAPLNRYRTDTNDNLITVMDMENDKWVIIELDSIITMESNGKTIYTAPPKITTTELPVGPKDNYIAFLQNNVCCIVFNKVNGDKREMTCTLNPNVISALGLQPSGPATNHQVKDNDIIRVVDLDKKDWRTFRLSKLSKLSTLISFSIGMNIAIPVEKVNVSVVPKRLTTLN